MKHLTAEQAIDIFKALLEYHKNENSNEEENDDWNYSPQGLRDKILKEVESTHIPKQQVIYFTGYVYERLTGKVLTESTLNSFMEEWKDMPSCMKG